MKKLWLFLATFLIASQAHADPPQVLGATPELRAITAPLRAKGTPLFAAPKIFGAALPYAISNALVPFGSGNASAYASAAGNVQFFNGTTDDCGGGVGALCLNTVTTEPTSYGASSLQMWTRAGGEQLAIAAGDIFIPFYATQGAVYAAKQFVLYFGNYPTSATTGTGGYGLGVALLGQPGQNATSGATGGAGGFFQGAGWLGGGTDTGTAGAGGSSTINGGLGGPVSAGTSSASMTGNGGNIFIAPGPAGLGTGTFTPGVDGYTLIQDHAGPNVFPGNPTIPNAADLYAIGGAGFGGNGNVISISTSGTTTLTRAQYKFPVLYLSASLTGNATVQFPFVFAGGVGASYGEWDVLTDGITLNGFTLSFSCGSTSQQIFPDGKHSIHVITYNTNAIQTTTNWGWSFLNLPSTTGTAQAGQPIASQSQTGQAGTSGANGGSGGTLGETAGTGGASDTGNAGGGGLATLASGAGGNASSTGTAGAGGTARIIGGAGGVSTSGPGGNGGNITINPGAAGTGTNSPTPGTIQFANYFGGQTIQQLGNEGMGYQSASPTIATTGTTVLPLTQGYDHAVIFLGTHTLTGNVVVQFPTTYQGYVDTSGITLGGNTLQFSNGTTTSAAITPSTTFPYFVQSRGSGVFLVNQQTSALLPTITLTGQVTGAASGGSIATTLTSANLPAITLTGSVTGSASGGSIATTLASAQLPTITLTGQVTGSASGGSIAATDRSVTTVAASTYAVAATTIDRTLFVNTTSYTPTITLPAPVAALRICVKDATGNATANFITVNPHSTETIDTVASGTTIWTPWGTQCFESDGTNWFTE